MRSDFHSDSRGSLGYFLECGLVHRTPPATRLVCFKAVLSRFSLEGFMARSIADDLATILSNWIRNPARLAAVRRPAAWRGSRQRRLSSSRCSTRYRLLTTMATLPGSSKADRLPNVKSVGWNFTRNKAMRGTRRVAEKTNYRRQGNPYCVPLVGMSRSTPSLKSSSHDRMHVPDPSRLIQQAVALSADGKPPRSRDPVSLDGGRGATSGR